VSEPKSIIPFTPVPVRHRNDGWTVEKQYAFIEALAETGIVEEACRRVGMSRTSADKLRRRPQGVHFRRAWQTACDYALYRVEEESHRRSREGVVRPIFYKGEQVGEWRYYDERLTAFLLRCYRPERYGRARELPVPRVDEFGHDLGPKIPASRSTAGYLVSNGVQRTCLRTKTTMGQTALAAMARNSRDSRARVEGTTLATSTSLCGGRRGPGQRKPLLDAARRTPAYAGNE
jgi:hypothetical protein